LKSHVSDFLRLVNCIYYDAITRCTAECSDLRDLETIRSRVEKEGISFLTITLPSFAKEFDRSLAQGYIDSTMFRGFRKIGSIPAFLQGMTSRIFDRETGRLYEQDGLLDHNVATFIDGVRQICLAFKKVELDCAPERVTAAISSFAQTEYSFDEFRVSQELYDLFRSVSVVLWTSCLSGIQLDKLRPRHGPGATSEGISGNQKFFWRRWYDRLEPYFPLFFNAYLLSAVDSEEARIVEVVPPELEKPVKVTPVPKTLKGPRIIAIEPVCMQYAQQAIRHALYERIENSVLAGGHVNFSDQTVNQGIALSASRDGRLATIDLSEASDRVPYRLALSMFDVHPDLRDAVDACRSTHAQLPDGTIIGPLKKFASMGSALCFPVEAMYFYTICVGALLRIQNLPVTHENVRMVSRDVYVYGDDIVVPSKHAVAVLDYLQKYNCKVNTDKSFWNGKFRESCGVEAYGGEMVTPTYVRKPQPENRQQADRLVSWIETANLFQKKGYVRTSSHIYNVCERYLGVLPFVSEDSPGLGRVTCRSYEITRERYNVELQRYEVKCWTTEPVYRADELDGHAALMKCLSGLEGRNPPDYISRVPIHILERESRSRLINNLVSPTDPLHLKRSARHGVVALKRRWVPANPAKLG